MHERVWIALVSDWMPIDLTRLDAKCIDGDLMVMNNPNYRDRDHDNDDEDEVQARRRRMIRMLEQNADPSSHELAIRMAKFWNYCDEIDEDELSMHQEQQKYQHGRDDRKR